MLKFQTVKGFVLLPVLVFSSILMMMAFFLLKIGINSQKFAFENYRFLCSVFLAQNCLEEAFYTYKTSNSTDFTISRDFDSGECTGKVSKSNNETLISAVGKCGETVIKIFGKIENGKIKNVMVR